MRDSCRASLSLSSRARRRFAPIQRSVHRFLARCAKYPAPIRSSSCWAGQPAHRFPRSTHQNFLDTISGDVRLALCIGIDCRRLLLSLSAGCRAAACSKPSATTQFLTIPGPLFVDLKFSDGRSIEVNVQRPALSSPRVRQSTEAEPTQPRWRKPNDTLCCRLEFVIQPGPNDVPLIVRAEPVGVSKSSVHPAKILIVEFVKEILSFDRPVTADHALDSAAHSPAPVKFLFVSIDEVKSATVGVAIVADTRIPIHPNAAAGGIKQPLIQGDADASPERRIEIAIAVPASIAVAEPPLGVRVDTTTFEIHVAAIGFNTQDDPVPLVIVTNLSAGDYARLAITPLPIKWTGAPGVELVPIDVHVLGVTELAADVQANVKAGPVALRQRRGRDLFHFLTTRQRFGPRQHCQGQRCERAAQNR